MMNRIWTLALMIAMGLFSVTILTGCEQESATEQAADDLEEVTDDMGDEMEEMGDDIEESVDEATE